MIKFFAGVALGALVASVVASTHPKETQTALKSGSDAIANTMVKGATSAQQLAHQNLPQAK